MPCERGGFGPDRLARKPLLPHQRLTPSFPWCCTLPSPQKEIIKYTRDDGLELNGTLYLPPGYDPQRDGPIPTLLWAYPREYKNKEAAGQMRKARPGGRGHA